MPIHEIIVFPGAGHVGNGAYDRGLVHGAYAEVDLVDRYYRTIAEELDNSAIRHRIAPTRKAPGLTREAFFSSILPRTLVIECRIGWHESKKVKLLRNFSALSVAGAVTEQFSRRLGEVLSHWGSIYAFGHSATKQKEALGGLPDGAGWIVLEPFQINGPKADDYAKWLPKLGTDIGRYLADYVRACNDSAAIKVQGYMQPRSRNG